MKRKKGKKSDKRPNTERTSEGTEGKRSNTEEFYCAVIKQREKPKRNYSSLLLNKLYSYS